MRRILLLFLLSAAPAAWGQAAGEHPRSTIDVVDACSGAADEETIGLTALEEECPGLTAALAQSGYLPLLSTSARDELDAYDLSDLLLVDSWYDEEPARPVDVAAVASVLDSLHAQEPERQRGWFERFRLWLRSLFERQSGGDESENWLTRWFDEVEVSEDAVRGILVTAMTLVVVLTIVVIANELRVIGVFRRRRGLQDADMVAGEVAVAAGDGSAALDALPANHQVQILLRMLVSTLVKSGRLRTERSLTHRELSARAAFDDAGQRESFSRVAALAERTMYGSAEVSTAEVEPIVAAARALDAQLRGAAT